MGPMDCSIVSFNTRYHRRSKSTDLPSSAKRKLRNWLAATLGSVMGFTSLESDSRRGEWSTPVG